MCREHTTLSRKNKQHIERLATVFILAKQGRKWNPSLNHNIISHYNMIHITEFVKNVDS